MLSEERFYALGGVPASEIIELLAKEQRQVVDAVAIAEAKEALFMGVLGAVQPVIPVLAIAEFYSEHLPMAIATGSPKWVAERILKSLGIRDWFGAVVGSECVANSKPAPDAYLRAAELIGVDPQPCPACIAILNVSHPLQVALDIEADLYLEGPKPGRQCLFDLV